jgi:hypothetical protein
MERYLVGALQQSDIRDNSAQRCEVGALMICLHNCPAVANAAGLTEFRRIVNGASAMAVGIGLYLRISRIPYRPHAPYCPADTSIRNTSRTGHAVICSQISACALIDGRLFGFRSTGLKSTGFKSLASNHGIRRRQHVSGLTVDPVIRGLRKRGPPARHDDNGQPK